MDFKFSNGILALYFNKWHEFKNFLSTLDDLPDVLCNQESRLTPKYQPSTQIIM